MEFVVGNEKWKMKYRNPKWFGFIRDNGTRTCAVTNGRKHTVYISTELEGKALEKVVCHELCHVFCITYGIVLDAVTEEIIANYVSDHGRSIVEKVDEIGKIIGYK